MFKFALGTSKSVLVVCIKSLYWRKLSLCCSGQNVHHQCIIYVGEKPPSRLCKVLGTKKLGNSSRFVRVILAQGHANLLCIVPMLTDSPRKESKINCFLAPDHAHPCVAMFISCLPWCGFHALKISCARWKPFCATHDVPIASVWWLICSVL